jgi:hypothetical protein
MLIIMLVTEIRALLALLVKSMSIKQLAEIIGSTYVRASQITVQLLLKGFVTRTDGIIGFAHTAHATFFRKISKRYDLEKLLGDSKEDVVLALLSVSDVRGIQEQTGLSYWTIKRSLNKIMETGAVEVKERRYYLADDEDLKFFLRLWREERQKRFVEPSAEVVYSSPVTILKRVSAGKSAAGSLTAFSVFSRYGVELHTLYSCYVQPERKLSIEEVLVHALIFATNPVELTDCAVFYAKNRDAMDLGKAREVARRLGVGDLAIDLENYVGNLTVSASERFLPWVEFAEKARLYGVVPEDLLPHVAFPDFMDELARKLNSEVHLYVFGGEAMRMRGLKRATKDVDVVVDDILSFVTLKETLVSLGYRALGGEEISVSERKLNPSGIFVKEAYPRVDIFLKSVCNAFQLSASMKSRCEVREMGKMGLHVMSNEDLFLLKSVTDREGDIYDMIQLAKAPGFDWSVVLNELYDQERETGRHFCMTLLDSVEIINERTKIRAPFYDKLVNHCIDQAVLESVRRWNVTTLKQIKELISYPDYRLRSRIEKLVGEGKLVKKEKGQFVIVPEAAINESF